MAIKLTQLRGFCAVMQDPNYSIKNTAQRIYVEVSALSRQISSLEDALGMALFERGHRKIIPTTEAHLFYKKAIGYVNGIEGLIGSFMEELEGLSDNQLNIATHYTAATYVFPDIIASLLNQKKFEKVNVKIMEITSDEAIKRLKNKEIDFAYFPFDTDYKVPIEFNAIKNIRNNHAIVLSKDHSLANKEKITAEDLGEHDFITRSKNISFNIDEYLELKHSNVSFENCSMDTSIEFARALNCMTGIPEKIFKSGKLKHNKNIVCINSNNLFKESYFQILTLKNFTMKYSAEFVIKELNKLVKNLN